MSKYANILNRRSKRHGMSLVELVIAMVIGSMVLAVVFVVYSNARRSVLTATAALERDELPDRIMQLIARDLDRFFADTEDAVFVLQPMRYEGLVSSKLIMESRLYDNQMRAKPYERITWEARYDYPTESLILYRGHSGLVSEDKLLESRRTDEEKNQLVPLCDGLMHFRITVMVNGKELDAYSVAALPQQVIVRVSFAEPQEEGGVLVIPEDQIVTRTIAVNRVRKIGYIFTEPAIADTNDTNDANDAGDPNK